jgi:ATP-binding cassette subfamily B multidrug efflux pump
MSDFREEEKLGKVYDTQLTRRLLKYLRPYKGWVWLGRLDELRRSGTELVGPVSVRHGY